MRPRAEIAIAVHRDRDRATSVRLRVHVMRPVDVVKGPAARFQQRTLRANGDIRPGRPIAPRMHPNRLEGCARPGVETVWTSRTIGFSH